MKNHYDTLGITARSSDAEIKRAYRKLAVLLHPDKNPLPEAEAAFKEVNAAYEVLSDPIARGLYNQILTNLSNQQPITPLHRDPAYRKRQQAGYKPHRPTDPSEKVLLMQGALPFFNKLAWWCCAWCLILLIDYYLPPRVYNERVQTYTSDRRQSGRRYQDFRLVTDQGHRFTLSAGESEYFPLGSDVRIKSSFFLSVLINLEATETGYELTNLATLYRNFIFAPIILFVLSLLGMLWKNSIEFNFNLGVVTFLILFLNIIFLYMSVL